MWVLPIMPLFIHVFKQSKFMKTIKVSTLAIIAILVASSISFADEKVSCHVEEYVNTVNPHSPARKAKNGIIIAGRGDTVRAFSGFSASKKNAIEYANCANLYKKTFGDTVNIYLTAIPLAAAYYTPDEGKEWTRSQAEILNTMFEALDEGVIPVDMYTILGQHAHEPIYSRTDHHWSPLGGYYAAKVLAEAAYVPFADLSQYEEVVIPNYVGTMYKFSGNDAAVKNSPEDFVYYKPLLQNYTTKYITGKGRYASGKEGEFFLNFSGTGSYCTFMGGDKKITQVRTNVDNGRRIIIIKDSFGNAIPGYLFQSFEEIHVLDYRYFDQNLIEYVSDNGITDIILANNISFACAPKAVKAYKKFLTQ